VLPQADRPAAGSTADSSADSTADSSADWTAGFGADSSADSRAGSTVDFAAAGFAARVRPDPGLLSVVRARLGEARLLGTEVYVCPPRYRRTRLRVELAARPGDPAGVRAALRAGLRRHLDPLIGGDAGHGWPFGGPVRPSALLRVAQAAVGDVGGDAAEVLRVLIGLDGAEPAEDCVDVPLRPGELVALERVDVRVAAGGTARVTVGEARS
jgi:hypothetical protein